jgi:hypothetical protein
MSNSVYQINKGINKPIEFKGLKAQYIWYFGGGLAALLVFFAILYISGVHPFICISIILVLGIGMTIKIYALSNTYGQFGLMKKIASGRVPKVIKSNSRGVFLCLGDVSLKKVNGVRNHK